MDDNTRGKVYRMLEIELEKEILPRTSWFRDSYTSKDVVLGYMIGLMEVEAEHIIGERIRESQRQKESLEEARRMIRDKIPSILTKIKLEQSK